VPNAFRLPKNNYREERVGILMSALCSAYLEIRLSQNTLQLTIFLTVFEEREDEKIKFNCFRSVSYDK
jgi:hypothetical protein